MTSAQNTNTLVVRWKKQEPDDVIKELTQRDQFSSEKVGLAEALVREAFQNILDAGADGRDGPIRVRVGITRPAEDAAPFMDGLLLGLRPHLTACGFNPSDADLRNPSFLVIEDFNTTGLTGPWRTSDPEGGWNGFFRAFGASNKGGRTGGRWGLGKLVFTSASAIRTFFALTVRFDDPHPDPLLMGQTILKTHKIGDDQYGSHGFLALDGTKGTIQLPAQDEAVIARFRREADVSRIQEPGLSVAVALPTGDVKRDDLLRFLLDNYFFPIIDGNLVVDVAGTPVTAENFDEVVKQFGGDSLKGGRMADFIRDIRTIRAQAPSAVAGAGWINADSLGLAADVVLSLREAYRDGKVVMVRFPIVLRGKDGTTQPTFVQVAMRKARDDEAGGALAVRGLLTVPGEADRIRPGGSYVALLADDDAIVTFLGDAEGPAHVDWNARAEKLNAAWMNAEARMREVRAAPRKLIEILSPAINEEDPNALIDELSVDSELRGAKPPSPASRKPKGIPDPTDDAVQAKPKFRLQKREGGFSVSAGSGLEEVDLPLRLRIKVAFDVPAGDPFKKHHKFDFDLTDSDSITLTEDGATAAAENPMTTIITAETSSFRVTFDGFDTQRDLIIDARRSTK